MSSGHFRACHLSSCSAFPGPLSTTSLTSAPAIVGLRSSGRKEERKKKERKKETKWGGSLNRVTEVSPPVHCGVPMSPGLSKECYGRRTSGQLRKMKGSSGGHVGERAHIIKQKQAGDRKLNAVVGRQKETQKARTAPYRQRLEHLPSCNPLLDAPYLLCIHLARIRPTLFVERKKSLTIHTIQMRETRKLAQIQPSDIMKLVT